MADLGWMTVAKGLVGLKEGAGAADNPQVIELYRLAGFGGIKHDEVPWCAAFVGACLAKAGIPPSGSLMARSYEQWGNGLEAPIYGCVATLKRGSGALGHVGFVVGASAEEIFLLGGNQGDKVCVAAFARARFTSFRYPKNLKTPTPPLPLPSSLAGAVRGASMA